MAAPPPRFNDRPPRWRKNGASQADDHARLAAFAAELRENGDPEDYRPVPCRPDASTLVETMKTRACSIRTGRSAAFRPKGDFDAYVADIDGEPVVVVAYVGRAEAVSA